MAKKFVESNKYVFSTKKYKKWARYNNAPINATWHNEINGRKVDVLNEQDGYVGIYGVGREWCKCIENNQGRL